jgi:dolichol-phosphate mannosyltransferase
VIPLLAAGLAEAFATPADAQGSTHLPGRWQRRAWPATVIALLLIYGTGWVYLVIGLPGVGYSAHTELVPVAWRQFGRRIGAIADALRVPSEGKLLIVGMDRYAIASELAFYSIDQTQSVAETSAGHLFGDMGLMYQQWFPPMVQAGKTLLLVAWDAGTLDDARFAGRVARISAIQEGYLVKDGLTVRPYFYRVAYGYRPGEGP